MLKKRDIKYWWQRRTRGWSDNETWNLNVEFVKWLNSRLKVYKRDASKIVDLTYHKIKHNGKEYTQIELINKLIKITDKMLKDPYLYQVANSKDMVEVENTKNEMYNIMKELHWYLWW